MILEEKCRIEYIGPVKNLFSGYLAHLAPKTRAQEVTCT
jgi:hypothetical protein